MFELIQGDCLEEMKKIPAGSIDMVLADPPYGTTACKWDSVIDLPLMWRRVNRIIKKNSAIVLCAGQPFTTVLIHSNIKKFKYCWIYKKRCASNFGTARFQPMKEHEDITVFSFDKCPYYPIKESRKGSGANRVKYKVTADTKTDCINDTLKNKTVINTEDLRQPSSVQEFNNRAAGDRGLHPTQKPVALMEYLIKTYTNEGDTVLDFTMGSGTTGVACANLGRKFIGIELTAEHFYPAQDRILNAYSGGLLD